MFNELKEKLAKLIFLAKVILANSWSKHQGSKFTTIATTISLSYGLESQGSFIIVLVIAQILSTSINVFRQSTSAIYGYTNIIGTPIITCCPLCFPFYQVLSL